MRGQGRQQVGTTPRFTGPVARKVRVLQDAASAAKCFVRKILRVSPCESRFCEERKSALSYKRFGINILRELQENNCSRKAARKSLFCKILPARSLESIFYEDQNRSGKWKLFEIKILAEVI
jgi:hypothetical protein